MSKAIHLSMNQSVASSITMGQSLEGETTEKDEQEGSETEMTSSRKTINEDCFINLFKEGMSIKEKEEIGRAQMNHLFRKYMAEKQTLLEAALAATEKGRETGEGKQK